MMQRSRLICWVPLKCKPSRSLAYPLLTTSIRGGESEALRSLAAFCEDAECVTTFLKPKTSPAVFDPPPTTLLVRVRSRA